jgi:hypothetical protein
MYGFEAARNHSLRSRSATSFDRENAIYVQRDFFSDANAIRKLFKSYIYCDIFHKFDEDAFFERFARGDFDRIVISNPYRDEKVRSIYDRARNLDIPLLIVERGAVPGSVFLDTSGFLRDSSLYGPEHWDRPLNEAEVIRLTDYKARIARGTDALEVQPRRENARTVRARLIKGRKYLCAVTLQMASDAVVEAFRDPDVTYDRYLEELAVTIASGVDDWAFVVKSHPKHPLSSIGGVATENDINISDLIGAADVVVTFNSGTGIMAFLHDKPVGCFGDAFYSGPDLAARLRSSGDLKTLLQAPGRTFSNEMRARFLNHLIFRIYSEFRFLGPLPCVNGKKTVAMQGKLIRIYDPATRTCREIDSRKRGLPDILDRESERLRAWHRAGLNKLERLRGNLSPC